MTSYEGKTRRLMPPCTQCGGTTFVWGELASQSGVVFVPTVPVDASVFEKLRPNYHRLKARMCATCYHVQMFAVPKDD